MSIKVPKAVRESHLTRKIIEAGLELLHLGKVRHTFAIPNRPDLLLAIATDRISIFDFVLTALVPEKGQVLTAMTVHWLTTVLCDVPNHLVAYGANIDKYLPENLRGNRELQARGLIVRKLNMVPIECIFRNNLTGSGWSAYKETGQVCGHTLPPDLYDGAHLPEPLFTPTTKAEEGHDEHLTIQEVEAKFGRKLGERTLNIGEDLSAACLSAGTIMADSKFEFGKDENGTLILADEIGTPDSSRFWDKQEWELIQSKPIEQRTSPSSNDKELVRQFGKTVTTPFTAKDKPIVGIHKLNPLNNEHLAFVHSMGIPGEVLLQTSDTYGNILTRLTGKDLRTFQREVMGIH